MLKSLIIAVSFFSYTTLSYASNDEVLQPDPAAQTITHVEISPIPASETTANERMLLPLSLRPLPAIPSQSFKQVDISPTPKSAAGMVEIKRSENPDSDKITFEVIKMWASELLTCCWKSIDKFDD